MAVIKGKPAVTYPPDGEMLNYASEENLGRLRKKNSELKDILSEGQTDVRVRLDADVAAWIRQNGPEYQTRVNAILREAMAAAQ